MSVRLSIFLLFLVTLVPIPCDGFHIHRMLSFTSRPSCGVSLNPIRQRSARYFEERDRDVMELMIGGRRYEMVDLPDSMVDTTLFVGNLCEFVTDEMLSDLFKEVSSLNYVPACVARKPNYSSLQYGFVTFPTVQEKEAAILRFSGFSLNGRPMLVEEIQDKPNRVRVPEKLVYYSVGEEKRAKDGSINTLRKAKNSRDDKKSCDDVASLSEKPTRYCRSKQKQREKINVASMTAKLHETERLSFERALRKGYLTIDGYYKGRKNSSLVSMYREWCSSRNIPQIIFSKSFSGKMMDLLIIDLSSLEVFRLSDDRDVVAQFLTSWRTTTFISADKYDMILKSSLEGDCSYFDVSEYQVSMNDTNLSFDIGDCNGSDICHRSTVIFEGQRELVKTMASELSTAWATSLNPEQLHDSNRAQQSIWKSQRRRGREI